MATIRDLATTEVCTVTPETTLREAAELLASEHVSGLPVVAGGQTVGVLSVGDVLNFETSPAGGSVYFTETWTDAGAALVERFAGMTRPERYALEEHSVSEAMTRRIHGLSPETGVIEAARYLVDHDIHRVLVVEYGVLVGVLTTTDIVQTVAAPRPAD